MYQGMYTGGLIVVPPRTRRCCDVESTSLMLIQRRNYAVCPVGVHRSAYLYAQGRRRFLNVDPTLGQCMVFTGNLLV